MFSLFFPVFLKFAVYFCNLTVFDNISKRQEKSVNKTIKFYKLQFFAHEKSVKKKNCPKKNLPKITGHSIFTASLKHRTARQTKAPIMHTNTQINADALYG